MVVAEREGVGEMSPLIKINGEEVPLEQPLAPVGVPVEFEVVTAEMKESQKSGKPMLEVQMKVVGTEAEGDLIYDYFVEPVSNKRTKTQLLRLATATGVAVGADGFDSEDLIGKKGSFVLKADEYQGQERRRLQDYIVEKEA
tara:strand:+ start:1306 stop:1731 length:426 start_codon:yes stop_codon:yes gene_type:complete